MAGTKFEHLGEALGTDFFNVRDQFTDEQWDHFVAIRRFVDSEVLPVTAGYWERAELAWPLIRRLPELGIVGEDIKGYDCAQMSPMACGLVHMELHRGDGSLGTFLGVHAGNGDAVDRDVRFRGAKGPVAARDGPDGEDRSLRVDRA
jgi:glutaryl-CoA dehydrogenase